jgi:hypothetical protein
MLPALITIAPWISWGAFELYYHGWPPFFAPAIIATLFLDAIVIGGFAWQSWQVNRMIRDGLVFQDSNVRILIVVCVSNIAFIANEFGAQLFPSMLNAPYQSPESLYFGWLTSLAVLVANIFLMTKLRIPAWAWLVGVDFLAPIVITVLAYRHGQLGEQCLTRWVAPIAGIWTARWLVLNSIIQSFLILKLWRKNHVPLQAAVIFGGVAILVFALCTIGTNIIMSDTGTDVPNCAGPLRAFWYP